MAAQSPMNVLAIQKYSGEKFIFFYDDFSGQEVCNTADKFAKNPDLSFTEKDAQAIKDRVKKPLWEN